MGHDSCMVDRTPGDGPWLWEQLGVRWADAALRSISVSYDDVVVVLEPDEDWRRQDSSGVSEVWIRCVGYLGIQIVGMWDESIVDHAVLHGDHPFAPRLRACGSRTQSHGGHWWQRRP